MRRLSQLVLTTGLAALYLLLVTPIGWLARLMGRRPIPMRPSPAARTYWSAIEIDTVDARVYHDGAVETGTRRSAREWPVLVRAYRQMTRGARIPAAWWPLAAMMPFGWLARPPQEPKISAELYVLF